MALLPLAALALALDRRADGPEHALAAPRRRRRVAGGAILGAGLLAALVVEAWWFTLVALVVGALAAGLAGRGGPGPGRARLAVPVSSRRGRAMLAVATVLIVSWAVGADLTMQHPARDGGQYVAIENGDVVRTLTRGEFEAAVMAQTRTIDLAGGLLALALGVLAAQAGIRTADELRARQAS